MSEDKPLLDPYKGVIIEIVVKQVMGVFIARLPWISMGPIAWVLGSILTKIFSIALDKTILGVNLYLIQVKTDGNVDELRSLIDEVNIVPIEEKEKRDEIERKIIDSSRNLIKLYDNRRV